MGWAVNDQRQCAWRTFMATDSHWRGALASAILLLFALAGCSRDDDEDRQQAVYRAAPGTTVQPGIPRGRVQPYPRQIPYQAGQEALAPQYQPQYQYQPPQYQYQPQYQPRYQTGPQFEIEDSSNPWAYRPTPQIPPPAGQAVPQPRWAQPAYPFSGGVPQQGTVQRFGRYRPLDSDKPATKRRRRDDYREQPGVPPEPYYPSQTYPYGGGYDPYSGARGGYPYGTPYGRGRPGW